MPVAVNIVLVTRVLAGIAAALVVVGAALEVRRTATLERNWANANRLFDLNGESNLPAWFSSSLLLLCALALGVIAADRLRAGDRFGPHWLVLAVIFVLLSADEAAWMHELTMDPVRRALGAGGFFYWAWVIPGLVVVALVGLAYLPFLSALAPSTRKLVVLAAAVYVGGALGLEMIQGALRDEWMLSSDATERATYALVIAVEEAMEMAGLIIFLVALLRHAGLLGVTLAVAGHDATAAGMTGSRRPAPGKPARSRRR